MVHVFDSATPCSSLLTEADAGHTEFMDEVFQNETRFPGGEWKAAAEPFTDVVRHANNEQPHQRSSYFSSKKDMHELCPKLCLSRLLSLFFKPQLNLLNLTEVSLLRMERKVEILESLTALRVGCGRMSGLWMTTELWMIKVQTFTSSSK